MRGIIGVGTNVNFEPRWQSPDLPSPTITTSDQKPGGGGWVLIGECEDFMPDQDKPPYRVPLMSEIAAMPWNGFNVVSTFAGCGGSSTGYRMAGFRVLLACEFIPAAQDTYRANARSGTIVEGRDIRQVTAEDILRQTGLKVGELDVFDGSPPCASFSTAGKREKAWGTVKKYSDTEQRSDDLFFEYARLIKGLQPKVFVAENVSGLVKGTAKGYFLEILQALKDCGYKVSARLLDAQWLGVPQARQRLIFVGVRNDLDIDPVHPDPLPYRYSIRDALPWLDGIETGINPDTGARSGFGVPQHDGDDPAPTVMAHGMNGKGKHQTVVRSRVVHDTSGQWGMGDVTDRPRPTITVGVNSVNSQHYQVHTVVEPTLVLDGDAAPNKAGNSFPRGKVYGVEEIVATGANGAFGEAAWQSPDLPARTIGASPNTGNGLAGAGDVLVRKIMPNDIVPDNVAATLEGYAIGDEWDKIGPGGQSEKYFQLVRPDLDGPSPTITASGGAGSTAGVTHPTEKRKFTIAELRRICGFPDDFILTGTYAQQWERLGRAVPPVMMMHIAATVRDQILRKL